MNGSNKMYLKDIFVASMPMKLQENLQLDASTSTMSLTKIQNEAKRRLKMLTDLHLKSVWF